ncbi:MAG: peptidoglycan DD-metalloendopeptidase family protein [Patescibacteria group bacterium]
MKYSIFAFALTLVVGGLLGSKTAYGATTGETFSVPVLFGVTASSVRSDFGEPRGNGTRSHEGQDMFAPKGTPIVSPTKATVIATGNGESAGKFVYTSNPGGEVFRYMHLDTIAPIRRGDRLNVGDIIGTVGDTGNAPDGVYHLHFEVRDDDNKATDPYVRLGADFTLKQKISFLPQHFKKLRNDGEYAAFLTSTFSKEIMEAARLGYDLPTAIDTELKKSGLGTAIDAQLALQKIIATIPSVLMSDLKTGDTGASVSLLQLYLLFSSTGPARDTLALSGATGYFGPATTAALAEYQTNNKLIASGIYNTLTRDIMMDV